MDSRPDVVEEVHEVRGTGISFSSKPYDLDEKAVDALGQITQKRPEELELEVHVNGLLEMGPQQLPKGFFLSHGRFPFWKNELINLNNNRWRSHGSLLGYGIGNYVSGYPGLKRTYVYQQGNHKTNWIMVVYILFHGGFYIQVDDVILCHVFQSDNYDPRPKPFPKSVPNIFDFHKKEVDSRMLQLEGLMKNPDSFKDFYEFGEMYSKCQAKERNGKRGEIWEHFTPIKVLGPDGEVMLTLAICHHCSIAYQTGKWDSKKGRFSNHGTKTLKDHYRDHHHITGNPQLEHHQIP